MMVASTFVPIAPLIAFFFLDLGIAAVDDQYLETGADQNLPCRAKQVFWRKMTL